MTTYHDYWLRGESQEDVQQALMAAGIALLESTTSSYGPVGTIWKDTGNMDSAGNLPVRVMQPLAGWHANLRMTHRMTFQQQAALEGLLIPKPANPVRIWAGEAE